MGRKVFAAVVGAVMLAAPALAHESKRTDKCGCHHQYGLRHCHPDMKTRKCEAPAKAGPRDDVRTPKTDVKT